MKKSILSFFLVLPMFFSCNSQSDMANIQAVFTGFNKFNQLHEESVEKHLEELKKGLQVPEVTRNSRMESDYMETHLIPVFPLVKEQICDHKNDEIFEGLMEIMIRTSGSAEEELSNILGKIYICRPDFTLAYIAKHQEYNLLIRRVDFGFLNFQHQNPNRAELPELKAKLDSLNEIKPFRNY